MPPNRYYSPRIDRGLIARLYHAAKARHVPMTVLTSRLVEKGLSQLEEECRPPETPIVEEEP